MRAADASPLPAASAWPGPLHGVRVTDVTGTVVGPLATQILGDLGADVVKIEPPGGDPLRQLGPARHPGMASMFLGFNRNKRSVCLDLKTAAAQDVLRCLVDRADVLVHNMRPGAARRLGIDYASLAANHPRLVHASVCGYRQDGPRRDQPAFDDVIQGGSGVTALFAASGDPARYAPFIIADKTVGQLLASAIVVALFERERSGIGQAVQLPMLEAMAEFNLLEHYWGRAFEPALGPAGYQRLFSRERRPLRTRDGHVCVTATTDAQWARLFTAVGRPELASDPRFERMEHRTHHFAEAYEHLSDALVQRSTAEWLAIFDAHDLPNGPAPSLDALFDDPDLEAGGFFLRYVHPSEGTLVTSRPATHFSRTPAGVFRPPPRLGEHTIEVMQELGFGSGHVDAVVGRPG